MLAHGSRQPAPWLIFDVRQRPKVDSPGIMIAQNQFPWARHAMPFFQFAFSNPILAGLGYVGSVASRFGSPVTFRGPGFGFSLEPISHCFRVRFPNGVFAFGSSNRSPHQMQFSNLQSPNKTLEPTITSVTPPADAGVAPAALVAHL